MNFWQTLYQLLGHKTPQPSQIRHLYSTHLGREVEIDVYLPPNYARSTTRRYPLVLFNDGQDLPRMHFADILQRLYNQKKIPPLIAVGIYAGHDRHREYGTARQADYKGRGDRAPQYRDFVLNELLPLLHRRFRTSQEVEETAFAGFSLGGLSAFDIAWARPDVFGAAGVFSGALWWRWSPVHPDHPDADRIMHDIVWHTPKPALHQRFWFQTGTLDETDDRNNNGVIDSIDDTLDLIHNLRHRGFRERHLRYLEMEGGRHEPATWGQAMPDFLDWLTATSSSLNPEM